MDEPDVIGRCLRAFADANVTYFLPLWSQLNRWPSRTTPRHELLLYRADPSGAYLVLCVAVARNDGSEVSWSIRMNAVPGALEISGGVEVEVNEETREIFGRSAKFTSSAEAAEFISHLAAEVCAQVV